jgi:hypothetical protein
MSWPCLDAAALVSWQQHAAAMEIHRNSLAALGKPPQVSAPQLLQLQQLQQQQLQQQHLQQHLHQQLPQHLQPSQFQPLLPPLQPKPEDKLFKNNCRVVTHQWVEDKYGKEATNAMVVAGWQKAFNEHGGSGFYAAGVRCVVLFLQSPWSLHHSCAGKSCM